MSVSGESAKTHFVGPVAKLEDAEVEVTSDSRLRVEFRIQDLVRQLLPEGELASHCGGCNGCMGCSM